MIADFFKPPTDNLYKFVCICGLLLLLISITYPPWLMHKNYLRILYLKRDSDLLTAEQKHLNEQLKREEQLRKLPDPIDAQIERLASIDWSRLSESERRVIIEEVRQVRSDLDKRLDNLIRKQDQFVSTHQQLESKRIELHHNLKESEFELTTLTVILLLSVVGIVIGILLLSQGFSAWSKRVQIYQDAILRRQAEAFETQPSPTQVAVSRDDDAG